MHHTSRPTHVRHHQAGPPQLHPPPHPTQPTGINVAPSLGPAPPPPASMQQQHHVTNISPSSIHGPPPPHITPYIPPHQRDANRLNHHAQQRIGSQMHQTQTKNRSHANLPGGLPPAITSNATQQQQQQQLNISAQANAILQQHKVLHQKTSMLQKPSMHQQQSTTHPQSHNTHQQLSKHPPLQPSSSLPPLITQRQHHQPPPPPSSSSSTSSSSHQQTLQQQQHNPQSIQPKAILSQKSNVQQKTHSITQSSNSQQQQQHTIILQKNPSISQNSTQQQQQQQKYSQNLSTSSSLQHKISKSQAQQNSTTNSSNSSNGGGSPSINTNVSNNIVSQQQSTVQSNQVITSQQTSQSMSTNRISANAENKSSTTASQKQQQQQDKTDQNCDLICDLICGNNQIHQTLAANDTLANTKEKTPMCLVNELARFNKIQHQYRLTGEQGPAHSKRFTVTLKLGEEEYTAEGPSIKKAQHSAAAEAVCKTKYTHPPVKTSRLKNGRIGAGNITPTVELNALAMKLGKPTVYVFDAIPPPPTSSSSSGPVAQVPTLTAAPLHHHQRHPTHSQHPHSHHQQQHNHHHGGGGVNGTSAIGVSIGTTAIPAQAQLNGGTATKSSSATHQQNHFPMHTSNHTFYQENHHYQSYPRQSSMNIYQPPPARYSGFTTRRPYSTRGGGGFLKYNLQPQMTTYNGGMSTVAAKQMCRISLMVGKQKFIGIGDTPQAARHDAAARALEVLKPLASSDESSDMNTSSNIDDPNADLKSPISLVHETALKRNLSVTFEVKLERGPPHMKTFVTVCKVGNLMTEGEGNGKKISKKRAAEKMLEELKKLPPLSPFKNNRSNNTSSSSDNVMMRVKNLKRKPQMIKKKTKNIIKDNSESIDNHDDINPISKLIQIQQALKEREPVYTLIEEKGAPRRREFVIEVTAGGHVARGSGPNKKMAKKLAAKNLLVLMGYDSTGPNKENNSKIANGIETIMSCCDEIVSTTRAAVSAVTATIKTVATAATNHQGGSAGRQIVPGLLLMQQQPIKSIDIDSTASQQEQKSTASNIRSLESSYGGSMMPATKNDTSINNNGSTISENATSKSPSSLIANNNINNNNTVSCDGVRPKDQLLYLADLLGFQVAFSDYPKGNHGEYLTIVTLSTDPPQICHGAGSDTDASQDKAAMTALQMLSNLGLDNVKPKKTSSC